MLGVEGHDSPQRENVLQYMVAMSHHPAPAPPRPLSSGQTRPICSLSPRFAHRGPQLGTTCAPIRGPHRPLTFPTAIQFSANTAVLVGVLRTYPAEFRPSCAARSPAPAPARRRRQVKEIGAARATRNSGTTRGRSLSGCWPRLIRPSRPGSNFPAIVMRDATAPDLLDEDPASSKGIRASRGARLDKGICAAAN